MKKKYIWISVISGIAALAAAAAAIAVFVKMRKNSKAALAEAEDEEAEDVEFQIDAEEDGEDAAFVPDEEAPDIQ